jgi:SOS-response transcriptional repressor LexA
MISIDTEATLKRYYRQKDLIILKPHGSSPVHRPLEFKNINAGFYIRGVMIAVL